MEWLVGYLDLSPLRTASETDYGTGSGGVPRVQVRLAGNADWRPSVAGDGLPLDRGRSNSAAARDRSFRKIRTPPDRLNCHRASCREKESNQLLIWPPTTMASEGTESGPRLPPTAAMIQNDDSRPRRG